jgi:hypothetical protein
MPSRNRKRLSMVKTYLLEESRDLFRAKDNCMKTSWKPCSPYPILTDGWANYGYGTGIRGDHDVCVAFL